MALLCSSPIRGRFIWLKRAGLEGREVVPGVGCESQLDGPSAAPPGVRLHTVSTPNCPLRAACFPQASELPRVDEALIGRRAPAV